MKNIFQYLIFLLYHLLSNHHVFASQDALNCTICFGEFTQLEQKFTVAVVDKTFEKVHNAHASLFHEECIKKWMKGNPTCPFCRQILEIEDERSMQLTPTCLTRFVLGCLFVINPLTGLSVWLISGIIYLIDCRVSEQRSLEDCDFLKDFVMIMQVIELILIGIWCCCCDAIERRNPPNQ